MDVAVVVDNAAFSRQRLPSGISVLDLLKGAAHDAIGTRLQKYLRSTAGSSAHNDEARTAIITTYPCGDTRFASALSSGVELRSPLVLHDPHEPNHGIASAIRMIEPWSGVLRQGCNVGLLEAIRTALLTLHDVRIRPNACILRLYLMYGVYLNIKCSPDYILGPRR